MSSTKSFVCHICNHVVDLDTTGCVAGKKLQYVYSPETRKITYAHPHCMAIRLSCRKLPNITKKQHVELICDVIEITENCEWCDKSIDIFDGAIKYGDCNHKWFHLSCCMFLHRLSCNVICPLCSDRPLAFKNTFDCWLKSPAPRCDNINNLAKDRPAISTTTGELISLVLVEKKQITTKFAFSDIHVCSAIVAKRRVDDIISSLSSGLPGDTIFSMLCAELSNPQIVDSVFEADRKPGSNVLEFLFENGYTLSDARLMGVRKEYVLGSPENCKIITNKAFASVEMLRTIGISFYMLAMAGVSFKQFAVANYTRDELRTLEFHAIIYAAMGADHEVWSCLGVNQHIIEQDPSFGYHNNMFSK